MQEDNIIDINLLQDKLAEYIARNWFIDLPTNIINFCNQEDLDIQSIKDMIPKPILKELELEGIEKGILKKGTVTKKIVLH